MRRNHVARGPDGSGVSDLSRVLQAEAQLAALVMQAEAEARQIMAEAESAARDLEDAAPRELADALTRLEQTELAWREAELARIEDQSARDLERYRAIGAEELERLTTLVLNQLVGAAR